MPDEPIRVCIVASTDLEFLKRIRDINGKKLKTNDLVLQYDHERMALVRIDGFRSTLVGLAPEFQSPIQDDTLSDILPRIQSLTNANSEYIWLEDDEWQSLRAKVIETNPSLERTIDDLEQAQQRKFGILKGDDAILFDAVRLAIQAFNPKNKRDVLKQLDQARDDFTSTTDTVQPLNNVIAKAIVSTEYGEPLDALDDPFYQDMDSLAQQDGGEVGAIEYDRANQPDGWQRTTDGISNIGRTERVKLIDPGSDRELILMMAHQRGAGGHDLAGADLIYDTHSHQSLVFVQYKPLSTTGTVQPSRIEPDQLEDMLSLCPINSCHNLLNNGYLDHTAMRLDNCPAFYKLLSNDPSIDDDQGQMPGTYIQSCLLKQLLESRETNPQILRRGLPHGMFYGLLGRTQIGSRADSYAQLRERILEFRTNILLYAAERRRQIANPTQSRRSRQPVSSS